MTEQTAATQQTAMRDLLAKNPDAAGPPAGTPDPLTVPGDAHGVTRWNYYVWRGNHDVVNGIIRISGQVVQQLTYKQVWIDGAGGGWHQRLWDGDLDLISEAEAEKLAGPSWPSA
jgi:hypothetical protein